MSSDDIQQLTVGQMIKADREAAGMTTQQLAQATKIMVTFVEALESGDISTLPGNVFAKGFIKSIYKVIGKDPTAVLVQFDIENGIENARVVPVTQVDRLQTDIVRRQSTSRGLPPKIVLAATVVGVALVAIIYFLSQQSQVKTAQVQASRAQPVQPILQDVAEDNEDDGEPVHEPIEVNQADEDVVAKVEKSGDLLKEDSIPAAEQPAVVPNVAEMQAESSTNAGQLLEITVKKTVKIKMNIDQKGWETNELEPDTYHFRFEDAASLLLYNAAAVEMSFNGKNLGALGDEGRVRRLSFVAGAPKNTGKM